MNIKSLLLGSAAALAAVSGARAADAVVVAEPEPMEYVRVCDTYGAGFYYIPGTETCLKISGRIRFDIDYSNQDDVFVPGTPAVVIPVLDANGDPVDGGFITIPATAGTTEVNGLDEGFAMSATAFIAADARSETEYGTFTRYIRFAGAYTPGTANTVVLDYAWISLGGLLVGKNDSLYDDDMGPEFDAGFGGSNVQIRYTADFGSGMNFAVSLEDNSYNTDYDPKIAAMLGFTQGWGTGKVFAAYDGDTEEWFVKGRVAVNATDAVVVEATAGYESGFSSLYSIDAPNYQRGYEWFVGGAVTFKATEKLSASIGAQGFFNSHFDGNDDYIVGGQLQYQVVDNLLARLTVDHIGGDSEEFERAKFRLEATF